MSTLTDLFTSMANKIRSKTGTQTTYTPAEMVSDGIDDVYDAGYAAGGGGSSATPITPSNSSPASMTAGNAYEPTANGYAISSYSSITPSSSSPVSLSSGSMYKSSSSGYAIDSYSSISPSSSGTYFSSGMKKMSSSGYAYTTEAPLAKIGSGILSTTADTGFTVGFKPKYLAIRVTNSAGTAMHITAIYDERYSTTAYQTSGTSSYLTSISLGSTSSNRLKTISSYGFTWTKSSSSSNLTLQYFAIG